MTTLTPIYIFFTFAMLFGFFTISLNSAFASALASNLFSVSCALLYFFLNSPDVSMTEVSIAVFLSTAIYLMTARIIRIEYFEVPKLSKVLLGVLISIAIAFFIYNSTKAIGNFGEVFIAFEGSSKEFLLSSYKDFHIPNVVTTILASFRGFDTMGETIIILTSAIGISLIIDSKNIKFLSF